MKPICIVGMHRSGTSMVSHLLHEAGLYLGPEDALRQASDDNLDGFWENPRMVEVNDAILSACGGAWDMPPKLPSSWKRVPGPADEVRLDAQLALREYGDRTHWGWKDPRTSLTGALWRELVPDLFAVVCLRNPLEVALSLARRNFLSYAQGVALWETYNRRLLAAFPRESRVITHYDSYFSDPERAFSRVLSATQIKRPSSESRASSMTVASGLRHETLTLRDLVDARVSRSVTSLYAEMCEEAEWVDGSGAEGAEPPTEVLAALRRSRRVGVWGALRSRRKGSTTAPDMTRVELRHLVEKTRRQAEATEHRDEAIVQLQAQLEEQMAQARRQTDEAAAQARRQMDEAAAQVQQFEDALSSRDVTIDALQAELAEAAKLATEVERLAGEVASRDESVAALEAELARVVEEAARATEEWGAERQRLQRLGDALSSRDVTIHALHAELAEAATLATEVERLAGEVASRDESVGALQAELAAAAAERAAEAQRLAEEIDARGAAIISLQAEVDEAEPELGRLREELARNEGRLEAVAEELENARAELVARNQRIEELGLALGEARSERDAALRGVPGGQAPASASDYARLVASIAETAARELPEGAHAAVIAKGDAVLLEAIGAGARHFPEADDGSYPGYYPADSGAAINVLEAQRAVGVEYLLVPSTAYWWFDHYSGFSDHLEETYSRVWSDDRCVIYSLEPVAELTTPPYEAFPGGNGVDIFCFPIIDWDFRFQRPQQLLTQFARNGHRVFYVRTTFQEDDAEPIVRTVAENVYEIQLPGPRDRNLYRDSLDPRTVEGLLDALHSLRQRAAVHRAIAIVDLPFWEPVARETRDRFGWKVIYDCMDNHAGFPETNETMLQFEEALTREADLVITSGRLLHDRLARIAPDVALIPNAVDFEHFAEPVFASELDRLPRPIVGYYGAIAAWFDVELVRDAALARPDWSFVLIGSTAGTDVGKLTGLRNVHLLGEQPYEKLPGYLHQFDVACIPFKPSPLIDATNPVKFYEYLAAGRPVVATELPELEAFSDFYYRAAGAEEFVAQIESALADDDPTKRHARLEFAKHHTWAHRYEALQSYISSWYPRASLAIVSYDNLEYLKLCLDSVWEKTRYPNFEVIVADNASSAELVDFLHRAAAAEPRLRLILNDTNVGFAAANNQAIASASGSEYMFLLNDDTVVTRNWLGSLIRYLQDEGIGLIGPVTNSSGNESRIDVPYDGLDGLDAFAEERARSHAGKTFDIRMLPMYCVGMRMRLLDKIGVLDERFAVGMFEDDDFSMRVRRGWYRVVCAEDVFVHHWGRTSFGRLDQVTYDRIFEANRQTYEEIWSQPWEPHQGRPQ